MISAIRYEIWESGGGHDSFISVYEDVIMAQRKCAELANDAEAIEEELTYKLVQCKRTVIHSYTGKAVGRWD